MQKIMALLGSQGIVVKCTAAIFFRTVRLRTSKSSWQLHSRQSTITFARRVRRSQRLSLRFS